GFARIEPSQARLDIAAERHDPQVRSLPLHEGLASQRCGTDRAAGGKLAQAPSPSADESIARVLALECCGQCQASREDGRQILGGMDRKIDRALEQRLLDFFGEQPLAAGFGERAVLDLVSGGSDGDELDRRNGEAVRRKERAAHKLGLLERQRAPARAEAQNARYRRGLHPATSQCYASV